MDNEKTAELVDWILDNVYAGVEEVETAPYAGSVPWPRGPHRPPSS